MGDLDIGLGPGSLASIPAPAALAWAESTDRFRGPQTASEQGTAVGGEAGPARRSGAGRGAGGTSPGARGVQLVRDGAEGPAVSWSWCAFPLSAFFYY